jgi:hypothetical protein
MQPTGRNPEQRYLVESMSGGIALIDYDRDGWPDIYFTNAQSVDMALAGEKAKSALFRNNHDGTFTDFTDKAGVGYPCWAMGAVVGDYNGDGLILKRIASTVSEKMPGLLQASHQLISKLQP